jgi:uncharacterized protein
MTTEAIAHPKIHVRDRRISRDELADRYWMRGDPIGTAFYNVLSASFPYTEAFFVETIRRFRDGVSPKLAEEIVAFVGQEVIHGREHNAFNRLIVASGYDVSEIQARVERRLKAIRARPPIVALAATAALEHFTAILAHEALVNPRHLRDSAPEVASLWRWHSLEEIEHKAVAYDTWLHVTRDWGRYRRWKLKSLVMLAVTRNWVDRMKGAIELLRQDGHDGFMVKLRLVWYLFGWPGMLRKVSGAWFRFFLPGFHPWKHDNRSLLTKTLDSYPLPGSMQQSPL